MSKIKQEKKVKGKVANFASLKERFVAAARNQFGPDEIDAEINDINQRWIPLVEIQNLSREDLGIIVLEKHELYTKKRIWPEVEAAIADRKSTRLNSSHLGISY